MMDKRNWGMGRSRSFGRGEVNEALTVTRRAGPRKKKLNIHLRYRAKRAKGRSRKNEKKIGERSRERSNLNSSTGE